MKSMLPTKNFQLSRSKSAPCSKYNDRRLAIRNDNRQFPSTTLNQYPFLGRCPSTENTSGETTQGHSLPTNHIQQPIKSQLLVKNHYRPRGLKNFNDYNITNNLQLITNELFSR